MSLDSARIPGVVTIYTIANSVLMKDGSLTPKDRRKIIQLVIEGYADLNLYHLNNIEVQYLYMDEAKTVSVPNDFVDWLKVGIPTGGKILVLTHDTYITLPRKFQDGKDVGNIDATSVNQTIFFMDHFRNGRFVGGLFGMPGGINQAYYRYDREKRQFIFTGDIPRGEIVLEYISAGVNLSGGTNIPRECSLPLQTYVFWQLAEYDKRVPANEKERKKRNYIEEENKLVAFSSTMTAEEYKDNLYRSLRQAPKR